MLHKSFCVFMIIALVLLAGAWFLDLDVGGYGVIAFILAVLSFMLDVYFDPDYEYSENPWDDDDY